MATGQVQSGAAAGGGRVNMTFEPRNKAPADDGNKAGDAEPPKQDDEIGRASCRERVSVRVDLGGRRIIKKKKQIKTHTAHRQNCKGIRSTVIAQECKLMSINRTSNS